MTGWRITYHRNFCTLLETGLADHDDLFIAIQPVPYLHIGAVCEPDAYLFTMRKPVFDYEHCRQGVFIDNCDPWNKQRIDMRVVDYVYACKGCGGR